MYFFPIQQLWPRWATLGRSVHHHVQPNVQPSLRFSLISLFCLFLPQFPKEFLSRQAHRATGCRGLGNLKPPASLLPLSVREAVDCPSQQYSAGRQGWGCRGGGHQLGHFASCCSLAM